MTRCSRLLMALLLAAASCDAEVTTGNEDGGGGLAGDGGTLPGGDGFSINPDALGAFCSGAGPIVVVGDGMAVHQACTGQIAETIFRNALCTCNDARLAGYLRTRAFDSSKGPFTDKDSDTGGAVGINRSYTISAGYTDVGGSMAIAGGQSLSFAGYLQARGDLRLGGAATVLGYTKVSRDGWLAGTFVGGPLDVGRDLHHQGNVLAIPVNVKGKNTTENVTVEKPCACEDKDILDVGAIVDLAMKSNDNAAVGLSPSLFNNLVGDVHIDLPCGRFFVEKIAGVGNLVINARGRVALFVGGDIDAIGRLQVNLDPKAEIDIFVKGNLLSIGQATFGEKSRPAATRIYMGGSGKVTLAGAGGFVGNVYAPRAEVTAVGFAEVYGSVYAKDFVSPGYAKFVYDIAITSAGKDCGTPPPAACSKCGTCTGGKACINGACAECTKDADCCGQDICFNGVCTPLTIG